MRKRTGIAVCLILAFFSSPSLSESDETIVEAVSQSLLVMLCSPTLYACSEATPESCESLTSIAFDQCPSTELERTAAAAIDGSGSDEAVAIESKEFGMCAVRNFRSLAAKQNISDECVTEAVLTSIEEMKNEARILLENRK